MTSMRHKNIVTVKDFHESPTDTHSQFSFYECWIVMEDCTGGNLLQHVHHGGVMADEPMI